MNERHDDLQEIIDAALREHAGAQDLLHKGDRAQGQVPEGRPAGKHLAGRLLARQAVVPHR